MKKLNPTLPAILILCLAPSALSHPFHAPSLPASVAGVLHPLTGWDHLLTTLAVGLWSARLAGNARFILPTIFLLAMALAAGVTTPGASLPLTEHALLASTIAFTFFAALAIRIPLRLASLMTATFAGFHGHAHAAELPPAMSNASYTCGVLFATALLLGTGLALGLLLRRWHDDDAFALKPS